MNPPADYAHSNPDWVRQATPDESWGFTVVPDGFVAWFPAGPQWRLAYEWETHARQCRFGSNTAGARCRNAPVAGINRSPGRAENWWLYCVDHLYGRHVENGIILERRLVTASTPNSVT